MGPLLHFRHEPGPQWKWGRAWRRELWEPSLHFLYNTTLMIILAELMTLPPDEANYNILIGFASSHSHRSRRPDPSSYFRYFNKAIEGSEIMTGKGYFPGQWWQKCTFSWEQGHHFEGISLIAAMAGCCIEASLVKKRPGVLSGRLSTGGFAAWHTQWDFQSTQPATCGWTTCQCGDC